MKIFKYKAVVIAISALIVIAVTLAIVLPIVYQHKVGEVSPQIWLRGDKYALDDSVVLEKQAGKDFVVLNLTDLQIDNSSDLAKTSTVYKTVKRAIEESKPDLITISGDNACDTFTRQCYRKLIKVFDSFEIPWAPVFGNHDIEGNADLNYLGDMLEKSEYCIFQKGPHNISGVGNYNVNIVENGKIVHTLILLDSHSGKNKYDDDVYGDNIRYEQARPDIPAYYKKRDEGTGLVRVGYDYDFINYDQIEWYKWVVSGVKALNDGETVESTTIFHIPLVEYYDAYVAWVDGGKKPEIGFGEMNEDCGPSSANTGMFNAILELGSTKNVIVGHDHINNYSILYQGVRLSYGMKTGRESYYKKEISGGSVLTIGADGKATFSHLYVRL